MVSTTSRYAFRALAHLAGVPQGEKILSRDIAAETGLPANYLAKILLRLRKAGIVQASRGSNGGYHLRRSPDEVTLLEIVELFDGSQHESECLLHPGRPCPATEVCPAHLEWLEVRQRYLEFLARKSVRSIASPAARAELEERVPCPSKDPELSQHPV